MTAVHHSNSTGPQSLPNNGQTANELLHAVQSVQPENTKRHGSEEHIMVHAKQTRRNAVKRELGFLMTADKKRQLTEFVESTIMCCQCSTYIPKESPLQKSSESRGYATDQLPCQCGHTYQWHVNKKCVGTDSNGAAASPSAGEVWDPAKHTKEIVTPSFGQVCFLGFNGGDSRYWAPYVRISANTSPKTVWQLVSRFWDLPPPQLLLSITGGAKRFFNKDRDTHIFKRELIDAVKATGAWVLTGGLGSGVMQYVGQAVSEYAASVGSTERHKLVLIGVCPWGAIDGRELLTSKQGGGQFPARYDAAKLCRPAAAVSCAALDVNHTHFICVDDGTIKQYGTEITWRAKFEKFIASYVKTGIDKEQSINVPVVQLLVNGGPGSLETVAQAISNDTPIMVIDGTKRAAELLATAYRMTRDTSQWNERTERLFLEKIIPIMHRTLKSATAEEQQYVLTIMKKRNLVTVFTLESLFGENTLDRVILQALMKANKADPKAQLSLALAWNKPDFARTEILNDSFDYKTLGGDRLHDPLLYSLINDQHQFAQLFLDCGIDLQGFLTLERIDKLYREVLNPRVKDPRAELMQLLIDRHFTTSSGPWELASIGDILTDLIGSYYPNEYKEFLMTDRRNDNKGQVPRSGNANIYSSLSCPEKHLLLWAVMFNRHELALMFWRCGINHIGTALIASKVASELADIAEEEGMDDATDSYRLLKQTFETLACDVLSECYDRNQQLTFVCLTRRIGSLGNTTALSIADDSAHTVFMEHTSCQLKLSRIWKGNIALYTPDWKLVLAAIFPFAVVPKLHFVRKSSSQPRTDEAEFDDMSQVPHTVSEVLVRAGKNAAGVTGEAAIQMGDYTALTESEEGRHLHGKYYSVGLTGRDKHKIGFAKALKYFFVAPVTKFIYNIISYLIFLIVFSIFLLTELAPLDRISDIRSYEPLVWIWSVSFIMEEIRQILAWPGKSLPYKFRRWWGDDWNKLDSAMYLLLIVAVILRFSLPKSQFEYARMVYVVSQSLFIIRSTQMFFVYKEIGPKILMIGKMLRDVFFFFFILLVFLMAFGVASRALLYPNAELNGALLGNVVFNAYFIIFGEIPIEEIINGDVGNCNSTALSTEFGPGGVCPKINWLSAIYLAIYCFIANILLINLLIAMFSFTFHDIQGHSETLWKYNRYSLIYEFFNRPHLPYPLIMLSHVYRLFRTAARRFCPCKDRFKERSDDFQVVLTEEETQRIVSFERVAMECHMTRTTRLEKENISTKVSTTSQRIEKVLENVDDIKENLKQIFLSAKDENGRMVIADHAPSAASVTGTKDADNQRQSTADSKAVKAVESAVLRLQEAVDDVNDRLLAMENKMGHKVDALHNRLDVVNEQFKLLNNKLDGIAQPMDTTAKADIKKSEHVQVKEAENAANTSSGEAESLTPVNTATVESQQTVT